MKNYVPARDLLRDRVILVTGAGSGIGKAAALSCAEHGATVVLLDRNEKKIRAVYDEIETRGLPEPAYFHMDLATASRALYAGLAVSIDREFGRLDGLLNNAGIPGTLTPLHLYDDRLWDKVMMVNLRAAYELTRACLDLLKSSMDASIIFTGSDVGKRGRAYWGAYCIASFATEGMVQVWAEELEGHSNMRVNIINPGPVNTDFRARLFPGDAPGTIVNPNEIMNTYLYLMGPDSKGISGGSFSAQED